MDGLSRGPVDDPVTTGSISFEGWRAPRRREKTHDQEWHGETLQRGKGLSDDGSVAHGIPRLVACEKCTREGAGLAEARRR